MRGNAYAAGEGKIAPFLDGGAVTFRQKPIKKGGLRGRCKCTRLGRAWIDGVSLVRGARTAARAGTCIGDCGAGEQVGGRCSRVRAIRAEDRGDAEVVKNTRR